MDVKKLAHTLVFVGLVAIMLSFFWWASFYGPIMKDLGGDLSSASSCIYSSSGGCSIASGVAQMVGKTPYNPILFWVGIVCLSVGVLVRITLKPPAKPPSSE